MNLTLHHVELFCRDAGASARWWQEVLGAELTSDQGPFKWVELGGVEILLRPGDAGNSTSYRSADHALVFAADNLIAAAEELTKRGAAFGHGDDDECLTLQDPDGHWIQLTTSS